MATKDTAIRFEDNALCPTRSHGAASAAISASGGGGVYPMRSLSRGLHKCRRPLNGRSMRSGDVEAAEDEDSGLRQAGDYKQRQVLMILSYT